MYLHLGQDTVVRTDHIVGIFDLDTSTVARGTRAFLAQAQKAGHVINVSEKLPKSFVLCAPQGEQTEWVYVSQISSATLRRRAGLPPG